VPHDELLANVWPEQPFIAGTSLPRCVAELRQTLGDHATESTVIQTIPKRGYRLIAMVGPAADVMPAAGTEAWRPPLMLSSRQSDLSVWLLRARQIATHLLRPFRHRLG
jgi:DNA-binding winged helix-turn-helix (wHTH) protein